jgi:hypothetical protein
MAVDHKPWSLVRALYASIFGTLGDHAVQGIHLEQGDEIRIDSTRSCVVLDGEVFEANTLRPIVLRSTPPVPFLRLAA